MLLIFCGNEHEQNTALVKYEYLIGHFAKYLNIDMENNVLSILPVGMDMSW